MAHLVEHAAEKPGAILTRVRVPVRQGIFHQESSSSADSPYSPRVQLHSSTFVHTLQITNSG